jgi:predicted 3-demethylubiquinone-9 3-methyltransferase (glyoxalase superfamily)
MEKITPCLWFDGKAEEAARFYTSVFKKSKMGAITRYGETGPGKKGSVMTVTFEIEGQEFMGLNGGPEFKFSEAISFVVHCKTQKQVDRYWDRLLKGGGKPVQCGWLTDKFGLSWQIVPTILPRMLKDKDPVKTERVMAAVMKMVKLDVKALKKAYKGKPAAAAASKA